MNNVVRLLAPVAVYPLLEHGPDDGLARRPDDERLVQLRLIRCVGVVGVIESDLVLTWLTLMM